MTDLLVCKTFRRDFGMITAWYLLSHRTWDRLCQPSVGSSFPPLGALPEEGADGVLNRIARRIAGSSSGHTARGRGFRA